MAALWCLVILVYFAFGGIANHTDFLLIVVFLLGDIAEYKKKHPYWTMFGRN